MFMFNWYQLLAFYTSTNSILKFVLYETSNSKPESVCTKVGFFLDCRTVFQCHTGQLLALFFICDFPGNLPVLASSIDMLKQLAATQCFDNATFLLLQRPKKREKNEDSPVDISMLVTSISHKPHPSIWKFLFWMWMWADKAVIFTALE